MNYHIMGTLGRGKTHRIATEQSKEAAENYVACLLAGNTGYSNAWYETENDSRTALENEVQQQIECDIAGGQD